MSETDKRIKKLLENPDFQKKYDAQTKHLLETDPSYREKWLTEHENIGMDYNLNNPEDLKHVKQLIDKKLDIERVQEENQTLKDTLSLISEQQTNKKLDSMGIKSQEMRDKFRANPELLKAYEEGLEHKGQSAPAGTAPCNEKQGYYENRNFDINEPLAKKVYPSFEAMLEELHDREAVFQGSPKGLEATRMLEAITRKFFEAHKETNSPVPILQKPLPKLISVNGLLVPEDPSMGDLQEGNRKFRRRKMLERAERASVNLNTHLGED